MEKLETTIEGRGLVSSKTQHLDVYGACTLVFILARVNICDMIQWTQVPYWGPYSALQ